EVMRLGALNKKLFIDGKRVWDSEYADVMIAITEYHRALLSRLMAD
ncbi:nikA protein, partial [Klebsiella pneumoniae]|nr:nikA protein [Klebsiella pneumoniae]